MQQLNNIKKTFIIAEIGVNHNGSYKLAKKMIKVLKELGVDAVKFQLFKSDLLVLPLTKKTKYQIWLLQFHRETSQKAQNRNGINVESVVLAGYQKKVSHH